MRSFFLGTCRVHEPGNALRERQVDVKMTPHRVHSPLQILQFIRHVVGTKRVFHRDNIHLMSDYAAAEVAAGRADDVLSVIDVNIAAAFRSAQAFLIEISTVREFPMTQPDGSTLYVDKLKMDAHSAVRTTRGETRAAMRDIKIALDRPIVWVPHVTPPLKPGLEPLITVRRQLAETVAEAAQILGDEFVDPSPVAEEVGAAAFFRENGEDTEHLTDLGAQRLATLYHDAVQRAVGAGSELPRVATA